MVDPKSGARCAVRDTRTVGGERYHWTVAVVGMPDPIASGRTSDVAAARSEAAAALGTYSMGERDQLGTRNRTDG
jgi:hypothetical protein